MRQSPWKLASQESCLNHVGTLKPFESLILNLEHTENTETLKRVKL